MRLTPQAWLITLGSFNREDEYRLRIGDWRVIFSQDGVVLDVLKVRPRGSAYED